MSEISFKYCPICNAELENGKIKFPAPQSIFDCIESEVHYYSDKTTEEYECHPIKKIFQTYDKSFTMSRLGEENRAGYCENCKKIFTEFDVTD